MEKDNIEKSTSIFDALGGECLEGSGFENETPEPESEWRDPR